MGMFDHLRCHHPLPLPGFEECVFQTKDLDCMLSEYEIRIDGTLWLETCEHEDRSDPGAAGYARLAGMLTRVNRRHAFCSNFTGEIGFYTGFGDRQTGFVQFCAAFAAGHLRDLILVSIQYPPDATQQVRRVASLR